MLRLLRDALALNNERVDLVSGNVLSVRPNADDTGALNIGDGTYDMDVKVFLGTTGEYVLFDVGNSQLTLACPLALTGDLTLTGALTVAGVTSLTDTVLAAEHGDGFISTAFAPRTSRRTVNGTIITEIKIDLDGLAAHATALRAIGLASGGADAYLGRNVVATNGVIYRVEMACIVVPAGAEADTLLVAGSASDEAYGETVANTATLCDSAGDWVAGKTIVNNAPAITTNYYYYLTGGDTNAGEYSAGQFVIRFYGHPLLT